ncbi:PEP-CTERM sorting domain-containing protein [Rubritalea marina]|nr:PEP-CTERM sorting domain-containing protein [Rubritalea marina]
MAKNSVIGSGLAFQVVQVAAVPEPISAVLLSIGTLGFLMKRRR